MSDDLVKRLREHEEHFLSQYAYTKYGVTAGEAADHIEALKAERKWQKIETAPKDGTNVLAATAGKHWVRVAYYLDGEGWYEVQGNDNFSLGDRLFPTHWMPLPPPPEDGK